MNLTKPTATDFDFGPEMRPPEWIVNGVIERGDVVVLSGDTTAGKTLGNLRLRVLPVLGHIRLREATTPQAQQFIDGLVSKGLAPATIDAALTP
jgi:RecA-family ATPase